MTPGASARTITGKVSQCMPSDTFSDFPILNGQQCELCAQQATRCAIFDDGSICELCADCMQRCRWIADNGEPLCDE
jgi:hypothetical protein